jgi:nitrogen regulatory protein PII
MKLITAIVRPGKQDELIETLIGHGARGLTGERDQAAV